MSNITQFLRDLPTASFAAGFDSEHTFGVVIQFTETDVGFGEVVFTVHKKSGLVTFDDEDMSLEHCGRIVGRVGEIAGEEK